VMYNVPPMSVAILCGSQDEELPKVGPMLIRPALASVTVSGGVLDIPNNPLGDT